MKIDYYLFGVLFAAFFSTIALTILVLRTILAGPRSSEPASQGKRSSASALFGAAVEKMPYAISLKDIQNNSIILYWNRAAEAILGIPKEAVLGKTAADLFPPASAELDAEMDRRAAALSEPVEDHDHVFQTHAKGDLVLSTKKFMLPDEAGKMRYVLTISEDITLRKQIEDEIRKGEDSLRKMVMAAPVMMWMSDKEGHFVYVNRYWAEFTGRSRETDLGDGWMGAVYPEDRAGVTQRYKAAIAAKKDFKLEYRMRQKDGNYRWVMNVGALRRNDEGEFAGFTGYCVDIDERKILEAQLLQSQKMETVGTLAGGIAHDLNNQLTPLSGYIDLMLKDTAESDPKKVLLEEAMQAAKRSAEVVQKLMGFSRSSTQKKDWMKIEGILHELSSMFPKFLPRTIVTEVSCQPDIWHILGNDTELQSVLMNLAANARDAMPEGGRLTFTAENTMLDPDDVRAGYEAGPYVHITVVDSGKGIPQDILQKIFDPFFTTKPKGKGTGLGLAMVFRTLKDHNGWVDVESEPGKGTSFHIYLPADPKAAPAANKTAEPNASALPRGTETILFADDEEPLRNLGKVFLERLGYTAIFAADGEEAIRLYRERSAEIHAVVMDMTMPKLTGKQTLKKILEIDPKAKVLVASGFTDEGSVKDILQEGASDFLTKPYTIHQLAQALRKTLDGPAV